MRITQPTNEGFTLVETLVAITVLILVVIGPITIAQKGIQSAYYAEEQMTAIFLAQEAIEAVRERRDDKALKAFDDSVTITDTSAWAPNNCGEGQDCGFDTGASNPIKQCVSLDLCQLSVDGDGKYVHSPAGIPSPFTRIINIGNEVDGGRPVTVTVSWDSVVFGSPRDVTLTTWIYDHYRRYQD